MRARLFAATLTAVALAACGGAPLRIAAMDDVERVRTGPDAQVGAKLAPEAYARAEQERRIAIAAHASGDDVAATLHAQRSLAAYDHARVVARLARASAEMADAQKTLDDTTTQTEAVEASRSQLEHDAQELEQRLRVARERLLPAPSAKAPADREAARQIATGSILVEARLLCDAAQLVTGGSAGDGGVAAAVADVGKLDERLAKGAGGPPAPIDDAMRARALCLDILTRARRTAGNDAGAADTLLAELSASGGWGPMMDERGIVVTLHDVFDGAALTADGTSKLQELGRVATAHPGFALQVVIHDAGGAGSGAPNALDDKRAEAAAKALGPAGMSSPRLKMELAGARAPLVDPRDAKTRGRNERLDVVFVASTR